MSLPDWDAVRQLSEGLALLLPELRIVASDIGLTDRGPVVVEVNDGGDMTLPQLASGKGIITPQMESFVEKSGKYKKLFVV
jgi:glutathione synthase/RimK-type ligase-like ATP-grasp enzyme